ncbi:MAG: L7Ae/L30e/S12e/Gadd45 family ribosomal protein [Oscillospiraceae bacterium]
MENKLFGLLSICRKSGRMAMGFDMSKEAAEKGRAELIILASDISPKTEKEVRFFSDKHSVKTVKTNFTIDDFFHGIGKKVGIITVCDKGFAQKAQSLIGENFGIKN